MRLRDTLVYCLMDAAMDGGGCWMLLMKGKAGYTFQYHSTHWSSDSTLNADSLDSTTSEDAKYPVFNDAPVTDLLAVFPDPDLPVGGCVSSSQQSYGWTWLQHDVWGGDAKTALEGFKVSRELGYRNDITSFCGWNYLIWSAQMQEGTSCQAYVINGEGLPNDGTTHINRVRWGFRQNENGENNFDSDDVAGGIGMDWRGTIKYSVGDFSERYSTRSSLGANRAFPFLLYGRSPPPPGDIATPPGFSSTCMLIPAARCNAILLCAFVSRQQPLLLVQIEWYALCLCACPMVAIVTDGSKYAAANFAAAN